MQTDTYTVKRSWRTRLQLRKGVLRRLLLIIFRRGYVRRQLALRQGECRRCGACCFLVANRCAFLRQDADGGCTGCSLYNFYRLPNCCYFPIDERDLADRNLVEPNVPCGYYWNRGE